MKDNHELAMEEHARRATWMEVHGGFARDMTMRDYFAGRALQGMLSENGGGALQNDELAELAYVISNAMLKARDAK
jgi:hypothetical protein